PPPPRPAAHRSASAAARPVPPRPGRRGPAPARPGTTATRSAPTLPARPPRPPAACPGRTSPPPASAAPPVPRNHGAPAPGSSRTRRLLARHHCPTRASITPATTHCISERSLIHPVPEEEVDQEPGEAVGHDRLPIHPGQPVDADRLPGGVVDCDREVLL